MSLQDELGLPRPFRDLRHETVLNIVRTANLISARATQIFRQFNLTEAQFNVLYTLQFTDGDITQAELGKRLVVTRASITSVLDRLEAKGLVERKKVPGNRRIHHVALTPQGGELIREVEPKYRDDIHRALSPLADDDCQLLVCHMEKTRSCIRDMLGNHPPAQSG